MTERVKTVATEALEWVGTPWRHHTSVKGVGCDCVGLVRGVGVACGVMNDPTLEATRPFKGYSVVPNPAVMKRGLGAFLHRIPVDEAGLGDVLWLRIARDPQHLGILVEGSRLMVHAANGHGVVRHSVDAKKWRNLIVAAWRYPGIAGE